MNKLFDFFFGVKGINEGEKVAVRFLIKNGYKIITQNYKVKFGEIDIIVRDKDILVFVEVKQRKNADFGRPSDFVGPKKQNKIRRTAKLYIMKNKIKSTCRFDVIEVLGDNKVNHIKNAF